MYNCYNEALEHLIKTYGERLVPYSGQHNKTTRTFKTEGLKADSEDAVIVRLMYQYNYGIEAKKDLYYTLIRRGIMQPETN